MLETGEITVGELIEKLSKYDSNMIVNVEDADGYAFPAVLVEREQALVIKADD